MKYGAVFPTNEIGNDPAAIRAWAEAAEDLDYSHIDAFDHVLGAVHEDRDPPLAGPYTEEHPFHEPFVLFGYLAAITTTIELETAILILPQRQTALVAKQAAEVDLLSGGRLRLGIGLGWNTVEYESLGVPWEARGKRMDEQVEVLRALWENDLVDIDTDLHRIDRAGIAPRPHRRIPLWFGGATSASIRRAVRLGDGFVSAAPPKVLARQMASFDEALAGAGRQREQIEFEYIVPYEVDDDARMTTIATARDLGVDHLTVNAMSTTAAWARSPAPYLEGVDEHIAALEHFRELTG